MRESTGNQCWRTPDNFWRVIQDEFAPSFDVACTREDARCFHGFYHPLWDALQQDWRAIGHNVIWCNPPFRTMEPWVRKCIQFTADKDYPRRVALLLAPLSCAAWMADCYSHACEIRDVYPRIQFEPPEGVKKSSNAKDNVLVVFQNIDTEHCCRRYWRWK